MHLVFVRDDRQQDFDTGKWLQAKTIVRQAAVKYKHLLSRLAILPDHVHMILGIHPSESPRAVALSYLNNLAYSQGMQPVFMQSCYVGTIGEYDLGAIE
ncbi:transposase [Anatilimnocola sp. NA78]|uniref:transposase n=1 Tax=Anatilimnocola sp. NA78 TaxID=3415683 RepID=UPI003CE4B16A